MISARSVVSLIPKCKFVALSTNGGSVGFAELRLHYPPNVRKIGYTQPGTGLLVRDFRLVLARLSACLRSGPPQGFECSFYDFPRSQHQEPLRWLVAERQ